MCCGNLNFVSALGELYCNTRLMRFVANVYQFLSQNACKNLVHTAVKYLQEINILFSIEMS